MGVDRTLNRHGSGLMNTIAMNDNADTLESGLSEALSRTNSTDNALSVDLDMGGNNIINVGGLSSILPTYTVATLPSATTAATLIYVSDETGGATIAFSDGTDWRRVQDRSVVS
jgi:hypothetical protein